MSLLMFKPFCFMFSAHILNCNYFFNYLLVVTSRAHFTHNVHCGQIDFSRGEKGQGLQVDTHLTFVLGYSEKCMHRFQQLRSLNETKDSSGGSTPCFCSNKGSNTSKENLQLPVFILSYKLEKGRIDGRAHGKKKAAKE